jgi:hypothetical protein
MNSIKMRLLGGGRRGYRQIVKFSTVSLQKRNLIIDCPIHDDAHALLQEFGSDLYLIAQQLKIVETIEIKADGGTVYQPHPIGLSYWE